VRKVVPAGTGTVVDPFSANARDNPVSFTAVVDMLLLRASDAPAGGRCTAVIASLNRPAPRGNGGSGATKDRAVDDSVEVADIATASALDVVRS